MDQLALLALEKESEETQGKAQESQEKAQENQEKTQESLGQ